MRSRFFQSDWRSRAACRSAWLSLFLSLALSATANAAEATAAASLPHLQRSGDVTQLIVDQRPFLILGGELGNSTASSPEALSGIFPKLRRLHVNTVLSPVYWELIEREEGKFDFGLVDHVIDEARTSGMRLVLLWFGAWKNSVSSYAPAWVKLDCKRFPRVLKRDGSAVDILSPLADETLAADGAAFAALMRHLLEYDGDRHTVLMVQVENEIGMIPEARDHSPTADAALARPVPKELMDRFTRGGDDALSRDLRDRWQSAGAKTSGSWVEVFGANADGEEVFTAWNFAKYVNDVARRGKAEYALPMYVNCALNRPGRAPGQYPSGGPLPHLIDVWRAAAPQLDMLSPDVYFFNFADMTERYRVPGNALFVPEAMRSPRASANAMYAIAQQGAIGFSPFAIEAIDDVETNLLGQTYGALAQLAPQILEHQARGETIGLSPKTGYDGSLDDSPQTIALGEKYTLRVHFAGGKRGPIDPAEITSGDPAMRGRNLPPSGGMILRTGPDEFTLVGNGLTIIPDATDRAMQAGLLDVEEWTARDGKWQPRRWLNGDQTNQGRELFLPMGSIAMLRVRLYQYH